MDYIIPFLRYELKYIFFLNSQLRYLCFFILCFFTPLSAQDSVGEFFENRFSLNPPSNEELQAVVQTVDNFLETISAHDLSKAYYFNTSKEFQAATPFHEFQLFVQQLEDIDFKQKLDKNHVTFTDTNRTKASFFVILNDKKKEERLYIEFYLANQDDIWKIMSINIYEISYTQKKQ